MNTKWLIENFEQDNKIWKLIAELKSRNQPLEIIDYYNFYLRGKVVTEDGLVTESTFKDDDCVIFQGSIQLALWIKRHKPWVPGVWLEPDKFKCTSYYSHLGEFLFNQDYEFTTVGEYKRKVDDYYKRFGRDNCLFIRPDTGLKSFTGQIFTRKRHETDWKFFNQTTKPEDIILVAAPKTMHAEYRVVIAKGEPISASMYQYEGKRKQLPGAPKNIMEFAKRVAAVIDKDMPLAPMYVIDVVETWEDEPRLMEINCFNCAGLYETDKKVIVDAANQIAWEEYQEYKKDEVRPQ
jgi:hypothetical protein